MATLFGIDIAKEIADGFKGQLITGSFSRTAAGARDPDNLAGGFAPGATTTYTFEGYTETREAKYIDGTLVRDAGEIVAILGASVVPLVVPKIGDVVTFTGGTALKLTKLIKRDPASALYQFAAEV